MCNAFMNIVSLDSVIMGGAVEIIGENAFSGCSGMDYIRVEALMPPVIRFFYE